jgi:hypothetical protein
MRAVEHETYRQLFGNYDHLSDEDFAAQEMDVSGRREASFDALKLYSGVFASLCTPMDRFVADSPTQDTHRWLARTRMDDEVVATGDDDELDMCEFASNMARVDPVPEDIKDAAMGSPRASSETYLLDRNYETAQGRTEQHARARGWRCWKFRRQKTAGCAETE